MKSLLHFCNFVVGLGRPDSQVTDAELALLLRHSRDAEVIVEIGCFEGKTSASLAENSSGTVYAIDPFFRGRLGICYGEWVAKIHSRRRGLKNVTFIKGLSHEVVREFRSPIDFLFVDADHTYEAIRRDWKDWFPRVKKGGLIALHDCRQAPNSPNYLGTMRFYDNDIPGIMGIQEVDAVGSLVILRVTG